MADKKVTSDPDKTEQITEKYRLWQIILTAVLAFSLPFIPTVVSFINKKFIEPTPIICSGSISITSPKNKEIIYTNEIDVTGVVKPVGPCKHIFLVVSSIEGHNYFITDFVTINPDGTWEATAKLHLIPAGKRARIQARLCGKPDTYPPEGCLSEVPSKGIASNSIVVRKE